MVHSTVSTQAENQQETVLTVNHSSTVSTELESSPDTETVLMVHSTVSTQAENQQETVLTVNHSSTVSTELESSPDIETVLMVHSTVSTKRRSRGEGTGRIQWRTITKKNGKQYKQAWYDWQIHQGDKVISKTAYIQSRLIQTIQELEEAKVPIIEILKLLGKTL
ncbi:hypothetical protein [Brasilonema sp. UFV-L1]|uniref:hypothetical protein n=1 Tax=Brasilonema sp. UFV-L1 TaxID=2234130 RepID=UPI00145CA9FD|nr:hypothetical protein [Brasilonema sp. UFV-L1]NMG10702.1 hypothetical protein [Brasilonema sp. UFV-L1]